MALGLRLEQRQSQQLVMTPQLQQAIKLLQLSNLELASFVAQELEANPLLIRAEDAVGQSETPGEDTAEETDTRPPGEDPGRLSELSEAGAENLYESAPLHRNGQEHRPLPTGAAGAAPDIPLEHLAADRISLRQHLLQQIGQAQAEHIEAKVAGFLVGLLDEHGYLREDLDGLAYALGVSGRTIADAVALLQSCDPTGVGARDLAECLALQLAERNRLDPAMATLLSHLDLVAGGDRRRLQALCGVDAEDIAEMLAELRALNPRPCADFAGAPVQVVVPDILLQRRDQGWHLELNPETLPRVLMDQHFMTRLDREGRLTDRWLHERRAEASWLIKSLESRATTILKVATEIVRHQDDFFEVGIPGLRPLTLRMVADRVGMHESTVSRVTANKFIATERGSYELRFFFTNAVGEEGDGVAAEVIRHRIRSLVDAEPAHAVLSDDRIVSLLARDGISVARRTVAKYRKHLQIPPSTQRRRIKAMAAQ
ncbi:MAG: RNA polymerase factor sigma-54 [Pseudomonadota bacterium]